MGGAHGAGNRSTVDVLTLEGFQATLEARLSEVESVRTSMVQALQRTPPSLGDFSDAMYVAGRYQTLYDQHLAAVDMLNQALLATQQALATITGNYTTNEDRLTADAMEIAETLESASGATNGDAHA